MSVASHVQELRKKHQNLSEAVERAQRAPGVDDLRVGARRCQRAGRGDRGDDAVGDEHVGRGAGGAHAADGTEQDGAHRASRPATVTAADAASLPDRTRSISSASAGEA